MATARLKARTICRVCLRSDGFSAPETTAVLLALSIFAGASGPHLQEYVELARLTKAHGDVRVLAVSLVRLLNDVGSIRSVRNHRTERPDLLVTDGALPTTQEPMAARWTAPIDGQGVQEMAAHLIDNSAGYQEGASAYGQWRGPYMDGLSPDPWGRRYTANVGMLWRPGGGITVVVSAGSNGIIETPFETIHLLPGGDDIVGMVWARH